MKIDDFNEYAFKRVKKYNIIYISMIVLTVIMFALAIVGSILELTVMYLPLYILGFVCIALALSGKKLKSSWQLALQRCPKCENFNISAEVDNNPKSFAQIKKFKCNDCGEEWDNTDLLKAITGKGQNIEEDIDIDNMEE